MKYAHEQLNKWRITLIHEERIQVAYIGVIYSSDTQTHMHILMLGKNRHGKTLSDVDCRKWARRWEHGIAEIEPIRNKIGADLYIRGHILKPNSKPIDFNLDLLKKLRGKEFVFSFDDVFPFPSLNPPMATGAELLPDEALSHHFPDKETQADPADMSSPMVDGVQHSRASDERQTVAGRSANRSRPPQNTRVT